MAEPFTLSMAIRKFFPDANSKEIIEFYKNLSPEEKRQFARELTEIFGEIVTVVSVPAK